MTAPEEQELRQLAEDALRKLAERFECVQILISFQESGETKRLFVGRGNWYARIGMAQEFVETDKAKELAAQIVKTANDEEENNG